MQVFPVPSSVRAPATRQYLTSFVVNEAVSIDAGAIGFGLTQKQQRKIKHIFVTHTHLDHLASLPMFLDCVYDGSGDCVTIHGTASTLDCLQRDLFNNRLWPDFIAISKTVPPYLKLQELQPRRPLEFEGMRITPIPVHHVIECMGYIVEDRDAAVVFSSDTGPTEEIWQAAHGLANLKAVFLEATFPDDMSRLADIAKHLTPTLLAQEAKKIPSHARILAVHLHTRLRAEVEAGIAEQNIPNLEIARFGKTYHF